MELLLKREVFTSKSTIGSLYIDNIFQCYTLEDVDRYLEAMPDIPEAKVHGKTAVPRGRYRLLLTFSKRFGKILPELLQVPGYQGVRIHTGNTDSDTEGCILPGRVKNIDSISESKLAFESLFAKIHTAIDAGQEVWITIS